VKSLELFCVTLPATGSIGMFPKGLPSDEFWLLFGNWVCRSWCDTTNVGVPEEFYGAKVIGSWS
jgi:hypothetical protein